MSTSTRQTIFNQLKTDIINNISILNGYNADIVEVINGIVDFDYFTVRPALGFHCWLDEIDPDKNRGGNRKAGLIRWLHIYLYGYVDVALDNYDPVYDLADDIETFLHSTDWTYAEYTKLEEGLSIEIPPGTDNNRAMVEVMIKIAYRQTF